MQKHPLGGINLLSDSPCVTKLHMSVHPVANKHPSTHKLLNQRDFQVLCDLSTPIADQIVGVVAAPMGGSSLALDNFPSVSIG
jgi:hypothetical protein